MLISTLRAAAEAEGIYDISCPPDNEEVQALEFYRSLGADPLHLPNKDAT